MQCRMLIAACCMLLAACTTKERKVKDLRYGFHLYRSAESTLGALFMIRKKVHGTLLEVHVKDLRFIIWLHPNLLTSLLY